MELRVTLNAGKTPALSVVPASRRMSVKTQYKAYLPERFGKNVAHRRILLKEGSLLNSQYLCRIMRQRDGTLLELSYNRKFPDRVAVDHNYWGNQVYKCSYPGRWKVKAKSR